MLSVALLLGFAGHAVAFAPGPVAGGVTGTAVVRTPQTLVATAADSPESILLALRESAQSAPAELTASLLSVGDTAERSAGELTRALTTAFTTAIAAPRSALESALSTGAEWDAIPSPFSPPGGPPAFEAPESLISVASSMQEAAISALTLLVDDPVAATTQLASVLQEPRTAAAAAFLVPLIAMAYQDLSAGGPASPYPAATYDAAASRGYFRRRPLAVFLRATELIARSSGFGVSVLADWLGGEESLRSKAPGRAEELAKLLTELGPTFIKAGQSASIRTDLLPPAYIEGLQQLQDQVPPFSSDEARRIITEELGSRPLVSLESLTTEPIAAASLGQVYKGRLQDGSEVAVKVQRPGMLYQIALDMYLIREFATPFAKLIGTPGDLVGTADAWGEGFVAELDYAQEATNAQRFTEQIIGSALEGRVFAPAVVGGASAGRVLTTEWVDGERLDRSSAPEDVPRLCSLAMNTYLEMMLEQGTLHCDPHPGNLLRTADGRLCVLDWGLVSTITPELQLTLIEHVAHLTAADYAKVPSDLVKLGFVPPGGEEVVRANGVSDFLSYTYSTWASGGGAAKLDVPALFNEVRKLAAGSADGIFQVPPYFAYIAKSFSVLEGIGLSVDKEYSIIQECLPYISRRIMTDPSPRTAGALETFIFGETKGDLANRVIDAKRVGMLIDGAQSYANSLGASEHGAGGGVGAGGTVDIEQAADALLDLLLSAETTPLQELAFEQLAVVLSASSRRTWADLRARSGSLSAFSSAQTSEETEMIDSSEEAARPAEAVRPAEAPRSLLGTLVDPFGLFRGSPLVENRESDEAALAAAAKLSEIALSLLPSREAQETSTAEAIEIAQMLVGKVWERRDNIPAASRLFTVKLLDQLMFRLERKKGGAF